MLPHTHMPGECSTGATTHASSRAILLVQSVEVSQEVQGSVPEDIVGINASL